MHPMLTIAVKAARRAGAIINRASQDLDRLTVQDKGHNEFVSEVDHAAEAAIVAVLHESYPDHAILAEESGAAGDSEYEWIIDPLDGTTNFLHGLPQYAVSIALRHRGVITHAVVYDPVRNDLFTAQRGVGAFLNDRRIRVTRRAHLKDALIGTGFPYRNMQYLEPYLAIFKELAQKTAGLRRPGAASLDLAYVAAGYFDGFFEFDLAPWDMAAGSLLIQEAGGIVTDMKGEGDFLESGHIVAGNPKILTQILAIADRVRQGG